MDEVIGEMIEPIQQRQAEFAEKIKTSAAALKAKNRDGNVSAARADSSSRLRF